MPASLGFMLEAILGVMGSQSKLNSGILSVRLSMGSLVFIAKCSVRSSCFLHLVVVNMWFCPILSCVQWSLTGGQKQIVCGRIQ